MAKMGELLKSLISIVLDENESEERLFAAVEGMLKLYEEKTGKYKDQLDATVINVLNGVALSSKGAAHCLVFTPMRTVVFLRGIYKAIIKAKREHPNERINIFYAGCGPYASLVTPFTSLFSSSEIGFYLLEINPQSMGTARELYSAMNIGEYVHSYEVDDATTCSLPIDTKMHIVLSETMNKALSEEPQVAIMMNLIPQMAADAVFIPEEIRVSLKLVSLETESRRNYIGNFEPECIELGDLYTIGRTHCNPPEPRTKQVPMNYGKFTILSLFTDIKVFENEWLRPYNSHLNEPVYVDIVDGKPGVKIIFTYNMTSIPGFTHKWEQFYFPGQEPRPKIFIR